MGYLLFRLFNRATLLKQAMEALDEDQPFQIFKLEICESS